MLTTERPQQEEQEHGAPLTNEPVKMINVEDNLGFDPTKKKRRRKVPASEQASNISLDMSQIDINPSKLQPVSEVTSFDLNLDSQILSPVIASEDVESQATSSLNIIESVLDIAPISSPLETASPSWADSDRDYEYKELLARICEKIVADKGLDDLKGSKKTIEPPEVGKVGTKRVAWVNFVSNCKSINRKPEHVLEFVLTELGATGSIAGDNKLIIKGRFQGKQLETVLRRYISEYVACRTCRSGNTDLKKENRILYKVCKDCGASPSVSSIKQGFRVQTRRRKA